MAHSDHDATRVDPYASFRFRLKWDGSHVAAFNKVGALTRTSKVVSHREGGDPHGMRAGPTEYEPITLERGITHDVAFEQWANKVWYYPDSGALGQEVSLKDFRKDVVIELFNGAGQRVMAYNVYRCWPSDYTAMPELDAAANGVAIQSLTLQNEGWERDPSVAEPADPSFTRPPGPG